MWTLIIILVVVALVYYINQKLNQKVANEHLSQGGFRKSFPIFTNQIENLYAMNFVNDNGREFAYSKQIKETNGNLGTLTVGVKLDMRDVPNIYSKFNNLNQREYLGIDVCGVNFNNPEKIQECINISINKIRDQGIEIPVL